MAPASVRRAAARIRAMFHSACQSAITRSFVADSGYWVSSLVNFVTNVMLQGKSVEEMAAALDLSTVAMVEQMNGSS
jgi:hypothetical protein